MRMRPAVGSLGVGLVLVALLFVGYRWALSGRESSEPDAGVRGGRIVGFVNRFVRSIPAPEEGAYDAPSSEEAGAIGDAYALLERGEVAEAAHRAATEDYRVKRVADGRHVYDVLVPGADAVDRGWGVYVHAEDSPSSVVVEVAHPRDDRYTAEIGVRAYTESGARDLLVAGADRDAGEGDEADVAHVDGTVFEAVHDAAVGSGDVVIQPHGFDRADHVGDGQAVVSNGASTPSAAAILIARRIEGAGYRVCLFRGHRCADLGGTTNVQGQAARQVGARFVQVEFSLGLRAAPARRARVTDALAGALRELGSGGGRESLAHLRRRHPLRRR